MDDKILEYLKNCSLKKTTVSLQEMERLFTGELNYAEFAARVEEFIREGLIKPVKSSGRAWGSEALYNTYRLNIAALKRDLVQKIEQFQFSAHPCIKLDAYFTLGEARWNLDYPYLVKLNDYLQEHGLPDSEVTAPEMSFRLTADEKWIDEKGGRSLLERIGLWDKLRITTQPDPLMLAINPACYGKKPYRHLIVENKTPYYALLEVLPETSFISLIYGAGWKIVANIEMLGKQLNLEGPHQLYYFGDLDYEGISIWYALNNKTAACPACTFYLALLSRPPVPGKKNQKRNQDAVAGFLRHFAPHEQQRILTTLEDNCYYPQETLNARELGDIWRREPWNSI